MSIRHLFAMFVVFCTVGQLGCCSMMQGGCGGGIRGMGPSCGLADASCGCPSCGVADASCGVADASCGMADASCGCPDGCGSRVGGGRGSAAMQPCPILGRLRNAICGSSTGCGGCDIRPYSNEWQDSPPSRCESCDQYGNYTGGRYGSRHGRRARLANSVNLADEFRTGGEGGGTVYR